MHLDARVAKIAAKQLGLITRAQFLAAKGTVGALEARLARGALVRIAPRVYLIGGAPRTWRVELLAGLMSLGKKAVVSHAAAAVLLGFDGFSEDQLEYTVPSGIRARAAGTVHRSRQLRKVDFQTVDKHFRCTTASRTIIDLAGSASITDAQLEKAIDSAVRDGRSSPAYLHKRLSALRGRGVAGVRRVEATLVDAGGHSYIEREFLRLMRKAGLPRPRTQVIHRRDGKTFARVDFEFRPLPLVVEVSGRRGHVTERDRDRDARRRNELQTNGSWCSSSRRRTWRDGRTTSSRP